MKTIVRILGAAMLVGLCFGMHYLTRKPVQPAPAEVEQVTSDTPTNKMIIVRMHGIKASVINK